MNYDIKFKPEGTVIKIFTIRDVDKVIKKKDYSNSTDTDTCIMTFIFEVFHTGLR